MDASPNAAQAVYWNDVVGGTWAAIHKLLDHQLTPLGRQAMVRLDPAPGERVLDIGCGAGQTSLELAEAVGPDGAVVGIDLSAPLLAAAKARTPAVKGLAFVQGDAQTFAFEPAFDAAFSRFGVMFFSDPAAAFANVLKGLKATGRLAFVCWRAPEENPSMVLAMQAAAPLVPDELQPDPPSPGAPGPFAFADPERIREILTEAGFLDIDISPHDAEVGAGDLDAAVDLSLRIGPLGSILRENPQLREAVEPVVRAALAPHEREDGVKLAAATWIVTAHAPGD